MNKDSKNKMLFQDFIPPTKQDWIERVTVDLKGADFDKKLVWKNLNGIDLQPFYTKNDQEKVLANTGKNSAQVINYRRINVAEVKEANRLGLKALEEGMTGLLFEISKSGLKKSFINTTPVSLYSSARVAGFSSGLIICIGKTFFYLVYKFYS